MKVDGMKMSVSMTLLFGGVMTLVSCTVYRCAYEDAIYVAVAALSLLSTVFYRGMNQMAAVSREGFDSEASAMVAGSPPDTGMRPAMYVSSDTRMGSGTWGPLEVVSSNGEATWEEGRGPRLPGGRLVGPPPDKLARRMDAYTWAIAMLPVRFVSDGVSALLRVQTSELGRDYAIRVGLEPDGRGGAKVSMDVGGERTESPPERSLAMGAPVMLAVTKRSDGSVRLSAHPLEQGSPAGFELMQARGGGGGVEPSNVPLSVGDDGLDAVYYMVAFYGAELDAAGEGALARYCAALAGDGDTGCPYGKEVGGDKRCLGMDWSSPASLVDAGACRRAIWERCSAGLGGAACYCWDSGDPRSGGEGCAAWKSFIGAGG